MARIQLFSGKTLVADASFIARVVNSGDYDRAVLPCVGSFTVPAAVAAAGFPRDRIFTSDVSIYSSVMGYLLDPDKRIEQMGLEPSEEVACFVEDATDDLDYAAGVLVAIGWLQQTRETRYHANLRREIVTHRALYRAELRAQLEQLVEAAGGIHYEDHDVRDVVASVADDPRAFLYFNLPGFKFGYTKMFGPAEEAFGWGGVVVQEFLPQYSGEVYESLVGKPVTAMTYVSSGTSSDRMEEVPPGWVKVYANVADEKKTGYLVTNQPHMDTSIHAPTLDHDIRHFPIYNDEEITPETQVAFVQVDEHTCLYYRDLFVHRLGITKAEQYFLMLLDGRVVTALGLHLRDFHLNKASFTDHIGEVFGITKTSRRYARLGKLFMLCLTSGDFKRLLLTIHTSMQFREPRGMRTSSITIHPEGKTDRSVMKLIYREEIGDGRYRLIYQADFRDDTWPETVQMWLRKWGGKSRA